MKCHKPTPPPPHYHTDTLHKAIDALDRDICLEILEAYEVVLWNLLLLRTYWDRLTMVYLAVGYNGTAFNGFWSMAQGGLMPLTILNMMVDLMVGHWVSLVTKGVEDP